MSQLNVRPTFGQAAASLETLRSLLGTPAPASVRELADLFARDVVFDEPIVTGDGVALGGHHTLTLSRDGSYRYQGHFRATGAPSYDAAIVMTVTYALASPDGASNAAQFAVAAHGTVHGTFDPGDREHSWDQTGTNPLIASHWEGVRRATMASRLEFDTDWFGPAGDVVSFLAQAVAFGVALGPVGVAIVVLGEAADLLNLEQLVIPGVVGVVFAGAACFVFGPALLIPAFLVGAAAAAALIKQRHLSPEERELAEKVFGATLPADRVLLTNLVGFGGRPFTCPAPGGAIIVNLGDGYNDPTRYNGDGSGDAGGQARGQLFIHELTHAWQIANESFTPQYYCRAVGTAAGSAGGDMSAYKYGPPTLAWGSLGTEQQASVVDEWFAGNEYPMKAGRQHSYAPMLKADDNPYWRYVRDNIRTGIA